jgi:HEPN domain-containing protein
VSPKPKIEVAREHLKKAREEAAQGDVRAAVVWAFPALEAAIDALAEDRGIAITKDHWKRKQTAEKLRDQGAFDQDLSSLHLLLNEERKGIAYDGEDPDLGGRTIGEVLDEIEAAVEIAEGDER